MSNFNSIERIEENIRVLLERKNSDYDKGIDSPDYIQRDINNLIAEKKKLQDETQTTNKGELQNSCF